MLKGKLYIDNQDAFTTYGAAVVMDGWGDIIAYPPLKAVAANEWQEYSGIEADLQAPKLDQREVQMRLAVIGRDTQYKALLSLLLDGRYHTFDCRAIGRTYRLRLVGVPALLVQDGVTILTLKMVEDEPLQGYVYQQPQSHLSANMTYTIDGQPITQYGLYFLQGTHEELRKPAELRANLLRTADNMIGGIYDNTATLAKSRDVKLYCFMTAPSLEALWRNYDALLYDLTRPRERVLYVQPLDTYFYGYYKSCHVDEFYTDSIIWLKFTPTLTLTR